MYRRLGHVDDGEKRGSPPPSHRLWSATNSDGDEGLDLSSDGAISLGFLSANREATPVGHGHNENDNDNDNDDDDEGREGAADSAAIQDHDETFVWEQASLVGQMKHMWTSSAVLRLVPSIVLALVIWFLPPPGGLTSTSMHLFGVFLGVIVSFVTNPYPMSVTVLLALALLALTLNFQCITKTGLKIDCNLCQTPMPDSDTLYSCNPHHDALLVALSGFSNSTVWLVFSAYQIGRAVEITGFGRRLSLLLVKYLGRSLVGLGYAVCMSEMILGPIVPSNTARGSIVMAVVVSICKTLGSLPHKNPVSGGGQYLILVGAHANLIAASMYQTGMAANPLVSEKAEEIFDIDWGFSQWLMGSCVPALAAFALLPWTMRLVSPASVDISAVRDNVKVELLSLGRMTKREWLLAATLSGCLILWVTSFASHIDSTLVAILGVVVLLVSGTLSWDDMLANKDAWDIMIWLAGLIVMADQLTALGLAGWAGNLVSSALVTVDPVLAALVLGVFYFYAMYMFCSLTGHIVAIGGPFLQAGKSLGTPPYLLVAIISYFSTLCGCLTNYSSGPIILYFSQKYVSAKKWLLLGLGVSISHIGVWFTIGMLWWKVLSFY